jgi:hypothetical protein
MMKAALLFLGVLGLAACSAAPKSPTVAELESDPAQLKAWHDKCVTGEYNNLPQDQQLTLCSPALEAGLAEANKARARNDAAMFKASAP